jgi:hypothetical protein
VTTSADICIEVYIERERERESDRERERERTMGDYLNNGRERWNITDPTGGLPDITVQNKFTRRVCFAVNDEGQAVMNCDYCQIR